MLDGANIDRMLEDAAGAGRVPGIVALAADGQGVVYQGAFGRRSVAGDAAMSTDTVFWIASMTKAVTSVAALQAVEEGLLELDGTLGHLVPELAAPQVLEGYDGDGSPRLRPASRQPTLRELLTHTAGYSYHMWNADILRYLEVAGVPGIISCERRALSLPMVADPGQRWEYGISIDFVGRAIEAVRGRPLGEVLAERIAGPLGMVDTLFRLGADQRCRLAAMHARTGDGELVVIDFEVPQAPEFQMGGGGLYSTGPDYLRFLRMVLAGGELDGARILKPETVAMMGRPQTGAIKVTGLTAVDLDVSNDAEFFPGMAKGWGLATMLNDEAAPTGRSAGSLAWAGLANSYYWADPTRRLCGLILTQILPFADAHVLDLFGRFETAMYQEMPMAA